MTSPAEALKAYNQYICTQTDFNWHDLYDLAEAMANELRALSESGGWRSMDSAPRNGTLITLYCPENTGNEIQTGYWAKARKGKPERFVLKNCNFAIQGPTTYWQPLPAPPKEDPK